MPREHFRHSALIEGIVITVVGVLVATAIVAGRGETPQSAQEPAGGQTHASVSLQGELLVPTTTMPEPTVIPTGTVGVGEVIPLAASGPGQLTLIRTDALPLLTQQEAMQAVYDRGIPWGLGDAYEGRIPELSAAYGLATFGSRAPDGNWVGKRNIPLVTGEVLDHIENRPIWILDYGNTRAYGSQVTFDHTVYAVDALTKTVVSTWFYNVIDEHIAVEPTEGISTPAP